MALAKFLRLKYVAAGSYNPGDPIWVNPAFVVAVMHGHKTGSQQHTKLRLQGDETHQDWTDVWDAPELVVSVLQEVALAKEDGR